MKHFPEDRGFSCRLIRPDTWYIHGRPDSAATYLLIGEEKALVLEPGQNRNSIREYIGKFTDKPLVVCNTHGHFDHTGANGQFSDCPIYMSQWAATECKRHLPKENHDDYSYDYEPIPVGEGFVIDLGGRKIEAIEAGCHSPGSLVWLDHKYRLMFTGDELESGQVLIHGERPCGACVEKYYHNLLKLKAFADAGEVDLLCPAHNGSPMDASMIDIFIENCLRIMDGHEGKRDISSPSYLAPDDPRGPEIIKRILADPYPRRSEWKGSSLVYSCNRIFLKDVEE